MTQDELILRVTAFHDLLSAVRDEPEQHIGPSTDRDPTPQASHIVPRCRRSLASFKRANARSHDGRRHPYLNAAQTRALYQAASFLGQETGSLLNVRVTLDHGRDRQGAGSDASAAVTDFCRRARALLQRRGQEDFPFLSVHEVTAEGHFVTELTAHVAPDQRLTHFTTWAEEDFTTTRRRTAPRVLVEACRATARAERIAFHATSLRRLLRGLDPNIYDWDEQDVRRPLVDLLGVPASQRRTIGAIDTAQRISTSDSLAPGARRRAEADGMVLLDPMRVRAWPWLFSGWELDEYRARMAERVTRVEARARIDALYPAGSNTLVSACRAAALADLEARCRWPAERRPRSWDGWLQPTTEQATPGDHSSSR